MSITLYLFDKHHVQNMEVNMKRVIASSSASNYETIFWSVYDSSYEV